MPRHPIRQNSLDKKSKFKMRYTTNPIIVTKDQLLKKKENAELGISLFEQEISEIGTITQEEIAEAERIESLLRRAKKARKLESKQLGLKDQKERHKALEKAIKDMEKAGVDQIEI